MAYRARTTCTSKNFGIGFSSSIKASLALILIISLFITVDAFAAPAPPAPSSDDDLVKLFEQWRTFEHPVVKNNVPDYSAKAMAAKYLGQSR
jgi:hypothetical protein